MLVLSRGGFCPKERRQHEGLLQLHREMQVGYCRLVTISTDNLLETNEFRTGVGAHWTFLSDPGRTVQKDLDIAEYTDPDHNPMIPHTLVLEPGLRVYKIYNGYWFFGRPTVEELRLDLRAVLQRCRPDWDISSASQRAAWANGEKAGFYPYGKTRLQVFAEEELTVMRALMSMARLVSVNVGLPRDIEWKGRTVHTGIWKDPVRGRCRVSRLNLDGDGQGDLAGHGGEQRAVFVYQLESYRYWQEQLKRNDFVHGQFGENFTIEGLPDDAVCIGDRYQIGSALFEITQPRVTCYRVGIRMNEPRMPALLTSSGRPGFYFRVLQEGEVGAGDEIVKVGEANGADDRRRDQRAALFAASPARSAGARRAD